MKTDEKLKVLERRIMEMGSLLIAFSGGVDSGFLAAVSNDLPGNRTHCVFLDSLFFPRSAVKEAEQMAQDLGLSFEIIRMPMMNEPWIKTNPQDRCYHCKKKAAQILLARARELGLSSVIDGMHKSDMGGHRPGLSASTEAGITHPFIEADISKEDIRILAQKRGLSFWNKPSAACLSSRIPYGEEITRNKLRMVECAEDLLRASGFSQVRVRYHGGIARIEVIPEEMPRLFKMREQIVLRLKVAGFSYVTIDLEGYRSGSLDEVLNSK
jgi:uncharacterized protein